MLQDHYTNVNFYCFAEVLVDKDVCFTECQMNCFIAQKYQCLNTLHFVHFKVLYVNYH